MCVREVLHCPSRARLLQPVCTQVAGNRTSLDSLEYQELLHLWSRWFKDVGTSRLESLQAVDWNTRPMRQPGLFRTSVRSVAISRIDVIHLFVTSLAVNCVPVDCKHTFAAAVPAHCAMHSTCAQLRAMHHPDHVHAHASFRSQHETEISAKCGS